MPLRLRLRLALAGLVGALLVVSVAATLQLRELAALTADVMAPHATLLRRTADMQRLLAEKERDSAFVASMQAAVDDARELGRSDPVLAAITELERAQLAYVSELEAPTGSPDDARLRAAVAVVAEQTERSAIEASAAVEDEAMTSSIGLGIVALLVVVLGGWLLRAARTTLVDRLEAIDEAVAAIDGGDEARRCPTSGADELSRLADALNRVLDLKDRADAEAKGRNGQLRASLVGLLGLWPTPAAIIGLDGEIMVCTLDARREQSLRGLCDDLRRATKAMLASPEAAAEPVESKVRVASEEVTVRGLRTAQRRVVGWLAEFPNS